MIKKITIVIFLLCLIVSCGKKGDPQYKESINKTIIEKNSTKSI